MLNSYLKRRPGGHIWQLRVPVPKDVQPLYGRREFTKSLGEADRAKAEAKALPIVVQLRAEWEALRRGPNGGTANNNEGTTESELYALGWKVFEAGKEAVAKKRGKLYAANPKEYENYVSRQRALQVGLVREIAGGNFDRWKNAALASLARESLPTDADTVAAFVQILAEASVAAIDVENRRELGELNAQPSSAALERAKKAQEAKERGELDIRFAALVETYMRMWRAGRSSPKETNTEQQKLATFKLFGDFWRDQPIRGVKHSDAARFRDLLKLMDPNWARSPKARNMHWDELVRDFGNRPKGLSASTMNRHMATLQSLWDWAQQRGHCDGRNPFSGFHTRIRLGENSQSYRAWETTELNRLFDPPPKRHDLTEVIIVAMFTGMRLDEIASLTWGRLCIGEGDDAAIAYFDIDDAKTPAGIRQVPLHPALGWLLKRQRGKSDERLWPKFNLEGVGAKAGADAGRMFSDFKQARGFKDRQKTFHSFRKNVTRIMERAGVPENEWAQVFGHERGFTYSVYNPDGITLSRKSEIISLIAYPGVDIPHPAE